MSLPDGSFSPQLWVARVLSGGTYEYERASQAGGSPSQQFHPAPDPVSPSDFQFSTPTNSRPGTAGYQPTNGPFGQSTGGSTGAYSPQDWSPGSSAYGGFVPRSPTHVYTPKPHTAAWETPRLPPSGYKYEIFKPLPYALSPFPVTNIPRAMSSSRVRNLMFLITDLTSPPPPFRSSSFGTSRSKP